MSWQVKKVLLFMHITVNNKDFIWSAVTGCCVYYFKVTNSFVIQLAQHKWSFGNTYSHSSCVNLSLHNLNRVKARCYLKTVKVCTCMCAHAQRTLGCLHTGTGACNNNSKIAAHVRVILCYEPQVQNSRINIYGSCDTVMMYESQSDTQMQIWQTLHVNFDDDLFTYWTLQVWQT